MMMQILCSEVVVKLANKLLRTYSPGLLSGSMLIGIIVWGFFSSWGQLTGWIGGLFPLYPFPTGNAGETKEKTVYLKLFSATEYCHHRDTRPYTDLVSPTC